MPRHRRSKHLRAPRPLRIGQDVRRRRLRGTTYLVRTIRAGTSVKEYRCPGCDHIVAAGVRHVVVWPEVPPIGSASGLDVRRHWHTYCWERA